ncbi:precorrin-2 dehydrogenase/sirohydrochlorin ferrochelatase family protein [Achromobacter marplatensis]|uniref:precorrin-2 dehydrogenase/sirohydrochlorin ferrochelatase family protein n=1 Tax=Achromobacter marplatensis TaxID=470868 RepID=UPI0039F72112
MKGDHPGLAACRDNPAKPTKLFPVFFNLAGRRVAVIGGGSVAERKVRLLLGTEAVIVVVAPVLVSWLQAMAEEGVVRHVPARFTPAHLDGAWLVIAATDQAGVNRAVSGAAQQRKIPCNVVDDPALSSFQVPAIIDRSPLMVAVSSGGSAPVLARRIRERFESLLDDGVGNLLNFAACHRSRIAQRLRDLGARRRFYDWMMDGPLMGLLTAGKDTQAGCVLEAALKESPTGTPEGSATILSGADGAADLLTLRALRTLNQADLIIHAPQANPAILDKARRDATRVALDLQTGTGGPETAGEDWFAWLAREVRSGRRVTILPGSASSAQTLARRLLECGVACAVL